MSGTMKKYINELRVQRNLLVNALKEKGVEASADEKFNTLIPKIADISGGGDEQYYYAEPSADALNEDSYLRYSVVNGTVKCRMLLDLKSSIPQYNERRIFTGLPSPGLGCDVDISDYNCGSQSKLLSSYGVFYLHLYSNGNLALCVKSNGLGTNNIIELSFEYPITEREDRILDFKTPVQINNSTYSTFTYSQNKDITRVSCWVRMVQSSITTPVLLCSGLPKPKYGKDVYRSLSNDNTALPATAHITPNGELYVSGNNNAFCGGFSYEGEWENSSVYELSENLTEWENTAPYLFTIGYSNDVNEITVNTDNHYEKLRHRVNVIKGKEYVFSFKVSSSSAVTQKNVDAYMLFPAYVSRQKDTLYYYYEGSIGTIAAADIMLDGSGEYTEYQIRFTAAETGVYNLVFDFSNFLDGYTYSGIKIKDITFEETEVTA